MKAYITDQVLLHGLRVVEGEPCSGYDRVLVVSNGKTGSAHMEKHYYKPFWHTSWQEALAQAEQIKEEAVQKLKKRLARIESLEFKEPN